MRKNKLIFLIIWIINLLLVLASIIIPKNETIYNFVYYIFIVCIFVVPFVLLIYEIRQFKSVGNNLILIHSCGNSILILLSTIRFIKTIISSIYPMFLTILFASLILQIILIYFSMNTKVYKKHVIFSICSNVILYLYFLLSMIISYDYSIVW